ncbi:MAG: MFS family permease [Candidatus Poriferisodalaceae bacterium]|jgi:MFS family permease
MSRRSSSSVNSTFATLRLRAFRRLWLGGLLYFLSIFAQMIARGSLAFDLTGSNASLGLVTMAFGVTGVLTVPMGGVVADRFPKRTVILISASMLLASSLWIAVAVQFGFIEFWMLLAASALQSAGFAGLAPARMAFTAELVGPELLANGVVLSQVSMNVNRVVGPLFAAAFLAVPILGVSGVYWFSSGLIVAGMVMFAGLPPGLPVAGRVPRRPIAEMRDGMAFAWQRPDLRLLLGTSTLVIMFGFPYVAFLPSIAENFFDGGDPEFAALSVVGAAGGVAASLWIAGHSDRGLAWLIQGVSGLVFGVSIVALGVAPNLWWGLAISLPLGGASAAFQSMNGTLILALAEPAYHGRMQSLLQLGFSMFGIFAYPIGRLADAWDLRSTLVTMGVLTTAVVAASVLVPRELRQLRTRSATKSS